MKKIVFVILSSVMLLTACSMSNSAPKDSVKKEQKQAIVIDGIKLSMEGQEVSPYITKTGQKSELYSFKMIGENISNVEKGLGASDFTLKTTDNKTVKPNYNVNYFGGAIKPGAILKGSVAFTLKKGQKAEKLIYNMNNKELMTWDVKN